MEGHIAFYRGHSWVSRCIRWFTRSEYSHVAYIDASGAVYEAWMPRVRKTANYHEGHKPGTVIDLYRCAMTWTQERAFIQYLESKVGAKYDTRGVLGFLSRRAGAQRAAKLFCSELILEASRHAHYPLIGRVPSYTVSPGHLSSSPLLWACGTLVTRRKEKRRRLACRPGAHRAQV